MYNAIVSGVLSALSKYAEQKVGLQKQKAELRAHLDVQRAIGIAQIRDATGASDADATAAYAVATALTLDSEPNVRVNDPLTALQLYRMGQIDAEQLMQVLQPPKPV